MDIGNLKNDYTYYNGYEDENEVILIIENEQALHIWEGYFDDILETPNLDGKGWKGFTKDYHQCEGIFSENNEICRIEPHEYLDDLMQYKEKSFEFDETKDVLSLIILLLEKAVKEKRTVFAKMV